MLIEIFFFAVIITLRVFEMISAKGFSAKLVLQILLVMCALLDFVIFAWKGEQLLEKSEKLRGRIFDCWWFNLRNDGSRTYRSIRSLLVTNMMIAKGVTIRAGSIIPLRLATYGGVSEHQSYKRLLNFFFFHRF